MQPLPVETRAPLVASHRAKVSQVSYGSDFYTTLSERSGAGSIGATGIDATDDRYSQTNAEASESDRTDSDTNETTESKGAEEDQGSGYLSDLPQSSERSAGTGEIAAGSNQGGLAGRGAAMVVALGTNVISDNSRRKPGRAAAPPERPADVTSRLPMTARDGPEVALTQISPPDRHEHMRTPLFKGGVGEVTGRLGSAVSQTVSVEEGTASGHDAHRRSGRVRSAVVSDDALRSQAGSELRIALGAGSRAEMSSTAGSSAQGQSARGGVADVPADTAAIASRADGRVFLSEHGAHSIGSPGAGAASDAGWGRRISIAAFPVAGLPQRPGSEAAAADDSALEEFEFAAAASLERHGRGAVSSVQGGSATGSVPLSYRSTGPASWPAEARVNNLDVDANTARDDVSLETLPEAGHAGGKPCEVGPTVTGSAANPPVPPVLRQLAEVAGHLRNGTVEIRLSPEELGRVRMKLVAGDGGLVLHLAAERPETLDLLRRHADLLQREFAEAGFCNLELNFGSAEEHGPEQDHGERAGATPGEPQDGPASEKSADGRGTPGAKTTSTLDIRI